MHYSIPTMLWLLIIWLVVANAIKCILECIENRPNTYKQTMDVKIIGYDSESKPPAIIVDTESRRHLRLNDCDKCYGELSQHYMNQWVTVTIANHYQGIIIFSITKKVVSLHKLNCDDTHK